MHILHVWREVRASRAKKTNFMTYLERLESQLLLTLLKSLNKNNPDSCQISFLEMTFL